MFAAKSFDLKLMPRRARSLPCMGEDMGINRVMRFNRRQAFFGF